MKTRILSIGFLLAGALSVGAQQFEAEKINPEDFKELKVKIGADFALQYQGLSHEADVELIDLKKNFNLPAANLYISAAGRLKFFLRSISSTSASRRTST